MNVTVSGDTIGLATGGARMQRSGIDIGKAIFLLVVLCALGTVALVLELAFPSH